MDLETQQNPDNNAERDDSSGRKVADMLARYKELLQQSDILEVDKRQLLEYLDTKSTKDHNPSHLVANISYIPHLEKGAKADLADYAKKMDDLNEKGRKTGLVLVTPMAKKEYLEWFSARPYDERKNILSKPFHKQTEREKLLENFSRLPHAERSHRATALNNMGLEEREKTVAELLKKHETLKAAFHALPDDTQKQYASKFKEMNLEEREKFLASMQKISPSGKKEMNENSERNKLLEDFQNQMIEDGVRQNLFSPLSIPANLAWAKTLSLERLQNTVNGKKSDLYARIDERVKTRDAFYDEAKIPASVRKPWELKFRNADLDKRKEILQTLLAEKNDKTGQKISYSESVMRRMLETTLADPEMAHLRVLYTLASKTFRLRRRAELRLEAKNTKDLAKKADERGNTVDDFDVFHLEGLEHHADQRFALKRFHVEKLGDGNNAVANNMRLLNREKREVSAEQFETQIVDHIEGELLAKLLDRAAKKLPQANRDDMRRLAHKLDFTVNLTEARAAA